MQKSDSGTGNSLERAKYLSARATDPDPTERYRALEEARRLPAAVRADVARHFAYDSSIWVRALAESLLGPPRGVIRRRPALLHELDQILRGTQVGSRQRASLVRLLEDAQAVGSTSDLALAADRASRLVTQALSEVDHKGHSPISQLQIFLWHVAAYAKPKPLSPDSVDLASLLSMLSSEREQVQVLTQVQARVNGQAVEVAIRELWDNAREAHARSVDVGTSVINSTATITIANDGAVLKDGDVAHLFKPWFTTKEGHAGLGLYLAQMALAEVGGDLQLTYQQPVTFVVTIPVLRR